MVKPSSRDISCYSEKSPQFFKIYVPRHCSQRLRIPPAFVKYFKGVIPFKSMLNSPPKRSWRVNVNKVENSFFFEEGWQEFVQVNSLKFGDFLIFSYNGNSEFHVSIFGKNNCQKQLPLLQRNLVFEPCSPNDLTSKNSGETGTRMNVNSRRPVPVQENIETRQTPCKFVSKNPFFESVLKPAYAHNGFMHVPAEFVKNYMSTDSHRLTARLEHSNMSWVVDLIRHKTKLSISRGWAKFVEDNTLQEGDVCSFELIRRDDYVFNVAFRKEESIKSTHPHSGEQVAEMTLHPGDPLENQENEGALDDSGKSICMHPFFQIVFTPGIGRSLNVPAEFRHSYMYKHRASAMLRHSNKSWPIKMTGDGRRRLYFSGGWPKFVKACTLHAGDVCRFELIERVDKYVFNVSVSRGKKMGLQLKRDVL